MKAKILKIGSACNNSCYFCFERGRAYQTDTKKILDEIGEARQDCEQLTITGREPAIHPDITEIVRRAKELQYKIIQIVSNGRMFAYRQFAREMILAGMTELLVPVYSHRAETHNKITGADKSLEQTMRGIRNIQEISKTVGPFDSVAVTAGTVVCPENTGDLPLIVPFLVKYGIGQLFIIRMIAAGGMRQPEPAEARAAISAAVSAASKLGLKLFTLGFEPAELLIPDGMAYENFIGSRPTPAPTESFDTPFYNSLK